MPAILARADNILYVIYRLEQRVLYLDLQLSRLGQFLELVTQLLAPMAR